ncbi:MAG: cysteine hydrolase [Labilithrix sp.]|nr:cysteine hydrolase [Labilithrix sp.]MCW5817358.1 cysteine hydrolase [Labilithrix sp.]
MKLDELLAAALTPRPERVEDGILAVAPEGPALHAALRDARESLSYLGRALDAEAPAPSLRAKLLATLKARAPRRALLVVDMIADHLTPGALLEVPRARAVVPALQARLDAARAAGVPVVYVLDEHEADDPDLDAWGTHAVRGSAGAEVWPDLAPRAGDRIVRKPSYSAFYESTLEPLLDELRVDTLVLTGCLTEIGLTATATDALQRGFAVEVPPDTQAGSCAEAETVALGTLRMMAPFGPARRARLERIAA